MCAKDAERAAAQRTWKPAESVMHLNANVPTCIMDTMGTHVIRDIRTYMRDAKKRKHRGHEAGNV
ncbi:hypothetical protein [Paenibacillus sp. TC-CSREp1]|uniref:hypothetical protein n=1 Tax=Paenibacillus sp. TC-CSREp1 TaxID=3410089 RepID=UPI003CFB23F6